MSSTENSVKVYALGPWCAICQVCELESGNVTEKKARDWAAAHECKGLQPCGCPVWLAEQSGMHDGVYHEAHYSECADYNDA